jgi:hypothetical protein
MFMDLSKMERYIVWGYKEEAMKGFTIQICEHSYFEDACDAAEEEEASGDWRWVHVEKIYE